MATNRELTMIQLTLILGAYQDIEEELVKVPVNLTTIQAANDQIGKAIAILMNSP